MARIRVCGVCMQPVAACICDDDPREPAAVTEAAEAAEELIEAERSQGLR